MLSQWQRWSAGREGSLVERAQPSSVTSDCLLSVRSSRAAVCSQLSSAQLYCIIATTARSLHLPLLQSAYNRFFALFPILDSFCLVFSWNISANPGRGCPNIGSWMYLSPRQEPVNDDLNNLSCKLLSLPTLTHFYVTSQGEFSSLFTKYWD